MKRLLVLCGMAALLVVPAASAGATGATLSADCSVCAAGNTITLTGTGYAPGKSYAVFAYAPDGSNYGAGLTPGAIGANGTLTQRLVASPPFFPGAGTYTVVVDLEQGRKLVVVARTVLAIN